jgi:hypothetical protein
MAWPVDLSSSAFLDLEDVKSRSDRKAIVNVLEKLAQFGPRLAPPHMKSLQGEPGLLELRPKRGASPVRLIYVRYEDRFVVLSAAPSKAVLARAIIDARARSKKFSK